MIWSATALAALLVALSVASSIQAAAPSGDETFCRNGGFTEEQDQFGLARVTGRGRLPFRGDMNGCPEAAGPCLSFGYVVPGDRVLTGRSLGPYVCAYDLRRDSAGWIDGARLDVEPTPARPPVDAWVGRWRDGDDGIRLTLRPDGSLRADGGAYWPGRRPLASEMPGGPHFGSLGAQAHPVGARLHLDEAGDGQGCVVDLTLVGAYLLARDNMRCGGMNVSFTGVYRRR